MTPSLPIMSGKDAVRVFVRDGWVEKSRRGSHVKLVKAGHPTPIILPVHGNKTLDRGTLASIIRHSGMTVEQFLDII